MFVGGGLLAVGRLESFRWTSVGFQATLVFVLADEVVPASTVVEGLTDTWKVRSTSGSLDATMLRSNSEATAYLVRLHCPSSLSLRTGKMNRYRQIC